MSFVTTLPEQLAATAAQLEGIGSDVSAAALTAALPTTALIPAAADEVSAVTASFFAGYGQLFQAISAQASAIHRELVSALGVGANSYAATETANMMSAGLSGIGAPGSGISTTANPGIPTSLPMSPGLNNAGNTNTGTRSPGRSPATAPGARPAPAPAAPAPAETPTARPTATPAGPAPATAPAAPMRAPGPVPRPTPTPAAPNLHEPRVTMPPTRMPETPVHRLAPTVTRGQAGTAGRLSVPASWAQAAVVAPATAGDAGAVAGAPAAAPMMGRAIPAETVRVMEMREFGTALAARALLPSVVG